MKIFEFSSYLAYQDKVRACTQRYVGTFMVRGYSKQVSSLEQQTRAAPNTSAGSAKLAFAPRSLVRLLNAEGVEQCSPGSRGFASAPWDSGRVALSTLKGLNKDCEPLSGFVQRMETKTPSLSSSS
jgi:hypothetical protein